MIGAGGGVFGDSASEFAEAEHGHAVGLASGGKVSMEGFERVGKFGQQTGMGCELVGVSVETVERRVVNRGAKPGLDELGNELQPCEPDR